ncbi:MAG: hypothetical protein WA748_01350 [Candidatus Acidiferrum sp.]
MPESRLGSTLRRDAWWVEILPVIILLGGFGLYATLRAFEGAYYAWGPYLSPFYSPLIDPSHHWWPWSPALLILGGPLGFRATCYYYRKAYYRAFFLDPPSCAVGEPSKRKYKGETKFPFILQNLHRYFFYIAVVFLAFLWYDAIVAYDWNGHFGIGVGTLIMSVNIIMLTLYTFSCHSLRHLAGGKLDCFSCATFGMPRHSAWSGISFLNERHMLLAWTSLITVGFTDFYIRMVAAGVFHDLRIL